MWATRFHWVDRAEAYDDLIDEARRAADAESRQKLQADRARFEWEDQARMEKLVLNLDNAAERLATAPQTEVTIVKRDEATSKKTTTKVKALSGRDLAALAKVRSDTARQTIQGYIRKDAVIDERKVERIVWVPAKDLNSAGQGHTGSRNQPIVDVDLDSESEEDKAA